MLEQNCWLTRNFNRSIPMTWGGALPRDNNKTGAAAGKKERKPLMSEHGLFI